MQKNKKQQLVQLIHIAKGKIGLSEADYRELLESVTGKQSCSDMSLPELDKTLGAMKQLGFSVKQMPVKEIEVGRASAEQLEYIKGMWEVCARIKTDKALYRFIERITGAEHPRFMDEKGAQKVITALRQMMAKSGHNPDIKGADIGNRA